MIHLDNKQWAIRGLYTHMIHLDTTQWDIRGLYTHMIHPDTLWDIKG